MIRYVRTTVDLGASEGNLLQDFGYLGEDRGDAPDPTYPTLDASSGPSHALGTGLLLGAAVDKENDGQQTATGDGEQGLSVRRWGGTWI